MVHDQDGQGEKNGRYQRKNHRCAPPSYEPDNGVNQMSDAQGRTNKKDAKQEEGKLSGEIWTRRKHLNEVHRDRST